MPFDVQDDAKRAVAARTTIGEGKHAARPTVDEAKRALRTRIARQRRRIDRRLVGTRRAAGELTSWRTYVRRFPLPMLLVAFGGGLLASRGLPWRSSTRWLVPLALRFALRSVQSRLKSDLAEVWSLSQPGDASAPDTRS